MTSCLNHDYLILIFIHFHIYFMKIHPLLSSLQRQNIFDKILVSENKANLLIALVQQPVSQIKMTFQEIRIIATAPCITNQLRDVNTICRKSWYIAAHIWKIYDFKIEIIPFIINFSTELITVVKSEV